MGCLHPPIPASNNACGVLAKSHSLWEPFFSPAGDGPKAPRPVCNHPLGGVLSGELSTCLSSSLGRCRDEGPAATSQTRRSRPPQPLSCAGAQVSHPAGPGEPGPPPPPPTPAVLAADRDSGWGCPGACPPGALCPGPGPSSRGDACPLTSCLAGPCCPESPHPPRTSPALGHSFRLPGRAFVRAGKPKLNLTPKT